MSVDLRAIVRRVQLDDSISHSKMFSISSYILLHSNTLVTLSRWTSKKTWFETMIVNRKYSHKLRVRRCVLSSDILWTWNSQRLFRVELLLAIMTEDVCETFSNRASMREALYSSIREIWNQCIEHSSVTTLNITVEIYENAERQNQWRISHESLYKQYVKSLLSVSNIFRCEKVKFQVHNIIDYSRLAQIRHLEKRGRTAVIRSSSSSKTLYVFKEIDFDAFSESRAHFQHQRDVCYHEIQTILSLSKHSNIISLSNIFITVRKIDDDQQVFICDALYSFMKHDTIDDQIQNIKTVEARLSLINKAAWCFQMTSTIAHAHFTTHIFHMNIKSVNFVLNSRKDLILIDWEQSEAALYILALEVDGFWDVKETRIDSSYRESADSAESKLMYEKY